MSFVHTPPEDSDTPTEVSARLAALLSPAIDEKIKTSDLLDLLDRHGYRVIVSDDSDLGIELVLKKVQAEGSDVAGTNDQPAWAGTREFARTLGVQSDDLAVIINGRVRLLL